MTKKTLVLYHGNCPDGFGAALAAWTAFGDEADYVPVNYGQEPPEVAGRRVLILDFSYPRSVLLEMAAAAESIQVLDHHKSAQEDLAGLPFAYFDMEHSGAVLAWMHIHPTEHVPQLLRYIEDRDLWRWELPDSRAVSLALMAMQRDFATWNQHLYSVGSLVLPGTAIVSYQDWMVRSMAKNARWRCVGGHIVPVANASVCFSEVGDLLCEQNPDAAFAAYWFDRGDGTRQWGLRSRNGFDVSVVAKQLGGGGHAVAAGFQERIVPHHRHEYQHGMDCFTLDDCENCKFASVGGLAARDQRVLAVTVGGVADTESFLRGYVDAAAIAYGEDWYNCEFRWSPAFTNPAEKPE